MINATTTPVPPIDAGYPKSMITIAVLASAIIFGILLAKVVDAFHDRQSIRDDASDISDYTRDLLKEQLAVAFVKGQQQELQPEELAKTYFKMWAKNVNKTTKSDSEDVENATICDTRPPSEAESTNTTSMQPHMPYAIPNTPTQWKLQASPVSPRHSPRPIKEESALAPIEISEEKKSPQRSVRSKKK